MSNSSEDFKNRFSELAGNDQLKAVNPTALAVITVVTLVLDQAKNLAEIQKLKNSNTA